MANTILWKPSAQRQQQSQMAAFIQHLNDRLQLGLPLEYHPLWQWSVDYPQEFWHEVCEFFAIIGDFSNAQPLQKKEGEAMFEAQFFVGGKINFAENLLQDADSRPALISWNESGRAGVVSRAELRLQVLQLAGCERMVLKQAILLRRICRILLKQWLLFWRVRLLGRFFRLR